MPLFDNRQAVNLRACEQMIESVLIQMGVNLDHSRTSLSPRGPSWTLAAGSAHIHVSLMRDPASVENIIQVTAPVFRPPADVAPQLWRRLLELNGHTLTGAAFSLREGAVVITTDRSTLGLDRVEIEDMIRRIGSYADRYDDLLQGEFGGAQGSDPSDAGSPSR